MRIVSSEHAWEDYLHWQKTDRKMVQRINALIVASSESRSKVSASRSL